MNDVHNRQFEVKEVDEIAIADDSALKGAVGGALLPSAVAATLRPRLITPIRTTRPIDLVMGKTTLI